MFDDELFTFESVKNDISKGVARIVLEDQTIVYATRSTNLVGQIEMPNNTNNSIICWDIIKDKWREINFGKIVNFTLIEINGKGNIDDY